MIELIRGLGVELLPWQRLALDRALVRVGDKWAHSEIAFVAPRQNGKSELLIARILAGLLWGWERLVLHTAQNRSLPRDLFEQLAELATGHRDIAKRIASLRWANGQERLVLKNGARYEIVAPRSQAIRGKRGVTLVVLDEVREHRTADVYSALLYTQRNTSSPQLWATSNAGDPDSLVLNRLRDRGRASAEPSRTTRGNQDGGSPARDPICWLEWSADPNLPPDDRRGWVQANPALGYLFGEDRLEAEYNADEPERFRREALCQWVEAAGKPAVPVAAWRAAARELPELEVTVPLYLAADIDPDRRAAALVAVAPTPAGGLVTDVLAYWTGDEVTEQVVADEILSWWRARRVLRIGFDPYTSTGIADLLEARGLPVEAVTGVRWYVACAQLGEVVSSGRLSHPGNPILSAQVEAAQRRDTTDGFYRMVRPSPDVPIPAATALARAISLASRPVPAPAIQ